MKQSSKLVEEVFRLELIVVVNTVVDEVALEELVAERDGFVDVTRKLVLNHPLCSLGADKALGVCGKVVLAVGNQG